MHFVNVRNDDDQPGDIAVSVGMMGIDVGRFPARRLSTQGGRASQHEHVNIPRQRNRFDWLRCVLVTSTQWFGANRLEICEIVIRASD
jgi:hypothetical protein